MKKICLLLICCLGMFWARESRADQGDMGVAGKAGTLGGGVEIRSGVYGDVYMRMGYNILMFDIESTSALTEYKMEADFHNGAFLMDVHPFSGIFRVTFGLFFPNSNEFSVNGTPRVENFPLEYAEFAPVAEDVKVRGNLSFNQMSPYLGFGWASNANQKGWGVAFDAGILYQGPPETDNLHLISSNYTQKELDEFREEISAIDDYLEKETAYLEDDLGGYEFYPVVSLTVSYNF